MYAHRSLPVPSFTQHGAADTHLPSYYRGVVAFPLARGETIDEATTPPGTVPGASGTQIATAGYRNCDRIHTLHIETTAGCEVTTEYVHTTAMGHAWEAQSAPTTGTLLERDLAATRASAGEATSTSAFTLAIARRPATPPVDQTDFEPCIEHHKSRISMVTRSAPSAARARPPPRLPLDGSPFKPHRSRLV